MFTKGFQVDKSTAPYKSWLLLRNYQLSLIEEQLIYLPLTKSEKIFRIAFGVLFFLIGILIIGVTTLYMYLNGVSSILVISIILGIGATAIGCIVFFLAFLKRDDSLIPYVNELLNGHEAFTEIVKPQLDGENGRRPTMRYIRKEQKVFASAMREYEILSESNKDTKTLNNQSIL